MKAAQCRGALSRLREPDWDVDRCIDAVWATCWYDATQGPEGLRDGRHANLPRIFGTSDGRRDRVERWADDWVEAGRPRSLAGSEVVSSGGRPPGATRVAPDMGGLQW